MITAQQAAELTVKSGKMKIHVTDTGSSNIAELAYDSGSQTLCVRFCHGGVYVYQDVPLNDVQAILEAPSMGSAFHYIIKDAGYHYHRLDVHPSSSHA